MYPVLFEIGNLKIHTYGVLVALGFLSGIILAFREARRVGEEPEKILDLAFYLIVAAIIGSRLLYVIIYYDYYWENPLEIIKIWKGGLVFYGGLIPALLVGIWYMRKNHMPIWRATDILAPSIAIGQAIGRLGCLSAGCCFGKETTLPWAIIFTHPETLARQGVPLHPTQLYSSVNALFIFLVLMIAKRFKRFDGFLIWLYVLLYAITRSLIEIFRGDARGFVFKDVLSISQFIGIIMGVISIFMLFYLGVRKKKVE